MEWWTYLYLNEGTHFWFCYYILLLTKVQVLLHWYGLYLFNGTRFLTSKLRIDGRDYHSKQVELIIRVQILHRNLFIIFSRVFPDWHVTSQFITEHLESALALDAKLSSHPIEVDCPDANHINQVLALIFRGLV